MKNIAVRTIVFLMFCALVFSCSPTPPVPTPADTATVPMQTPFPTPVLPTATLTEMPIPMETAQPAILRMMITDVHAIRIDGYAMEPGWKTVYITTEYPDLFREVAWSPNDSKFVYAMSKSGLYIYSLETDRVEALKPTLDASDGMTNGRVDWSPDNQWIAFGRDRNHGYRSPGTSIYLIHPDGTGYHPIFTYPTEMPSGRVAAVSSWTPDSKYILFSLLGGNRNDIYIVDVEGTRPQKLISTRLNSVYFPVAVSPDGKTIYYPSNEGIRMSPIDCYYNHSCKEIPSKPADMFPVTWYKDYTPRWTGDFPTFYEKYGLP